MQASMQASSRREHEAPAPSQHRHSTFHGAPSTGLRLLHGFSQGKDGQRRGGGDAMPVIPRRKDGEVQQCWELGKPGTGVPHRQHSSSGRGDDSCSAPCKLPLCMSPLPGSLGHKAPTAEAGSSSGLAGGWTSVTPWKVKKRKERYPLRCLPV